MNKILVVDDDSSLLELLTNRLENYGFAVFTATDGVEAYEMVKDVLPDMIILDVLMPSMDGYTFLQELKWQEDLKNIPVLVLTGKPNTYELFEAIGVTNIMVKPFDSDELMKNINGFMQN